MKKLSKEQLIVFAVTATISVGGVMLIQNSLCNSKEKTSTKHNVEQEYSHTEWSSWYTRDELTELGIKRKSVDQIIIAYYANVDGKEESIYENVFCFIDSEGRELDIEIKDDTKDNKPIQYYRFRIKPIDFIIGEKEKSYTKR